MNFSLSLNISDGINRILILRLFIFISILIWCLGFSVTSLFPNSMYVVFYPFLKHVYSFVCHQVDYKTLQINDIHFLVCARCTGIYTGALLTCIVLAFNNVKSDLKSIFLFFSAIPMIIDIIFYSVGVYNYSIITAFSTGIIFGSVSIVYILIVLQKIFSQEQMVPDDLK